MRCGSVQGSAVLVLLKIHFDIVRNWDAGTLWCSDRQSHHRKILDHFHGMSHPSIRSTTNMIADHFFWKNIRQNIRQWVRHCLTCQVSRIHKHTRNPISAFLLPGDRFRHIHVDIEGPLPNSNSFTYSLTCVDRFTRWPIAVPLSDTSTETVGRKLMYSWISMFGVPPTITTDRGSLFSSSSFRQPSHLLGSTHIRTTAHHPAANGLVEQLRSALIAPSITIWLVGTPSN